MELIGIAAGILELLAVYLVGIKNKYGFIAGILGNILWITFVILTKGSYGLLVVSPVAFILNIKGYYYWSKNDS